MPLTALAGNYCYQVVRCVSPGSRSAARAMDEMKKAGQRSLFALDDAEDDSDLRNQFPMSFGALSVLRKGETCGQAGFQFVAQRPLPVQANRNPNMRREAHSTKGPSAGRQDQQGNQLRKLRHLYRSPSGPCLCRPEKAAAHLRLQQAGSSRKPRPGEGRRWTLPGHQPRRTRSRGPAQRLHRRGLPMVPRQQPT